MVEFSSDQAPFLGKEEGNYAFRGLKSHWIHNKDGPFRIADGWPRIWRELRKQGIRAGKRRVQRLMQQHGICARGKRRFRVTTTDSEHNLPIAPNLLDRNFTASSPNLVWTGDISAP